MEKLGMLGEHKDYEMRYFYCCGTNKDIKSGCVIKERIDSGGVMKCERNLKVFIAQIRYYPCDPKYV